MSDVYNQKFLIDTQTTTENILVKYDETQDQTPKNKNKQDTPQKTQINTSQNKVVM